jgi:hypothetical protein
MKKQILATVVSILIAVNPLWADASYLKKQTIKSAISAMSSSPLMALTKQMGGGDMLKELEPTTDVIMVHGNKMVTVSKRGSSIMDLDKQAWIQTDAAKHEYYVMTFQQMSDMMARVEDMMKTPPPMPNASKPGDGQMQTETTVDVTEEHPGTTKEVAGYTATEHIFKATIKTHMTGTSGNGEPVAMTTTMLYTEEIWVINEVPPAYQAVLDFYKMAGEKMSSVMSPAAKAAMPQGIPNTPGTQNGMMELRRRVSALKGLHVIEVTKVGMPVDPAMMAAAQGQEATPAAPAPAPATTGGQQQQPTNTPPAPAIGGLGGALARGVLGGFGRKTAAPAAAPAPAPAATPAPVATAQAPGAAAGNPFLSETTIELSNFSTQPVVLSEFEVPAGYKQVQSPIEKMMKTPAK